MIQPVESLSFYGTPLQGESRQGGSRQGNILGTLILRWLHDLKGLKCEVIALQVLVLSLSLFMQSFRSPRWRLLGAGCWKRVTLQRSTWHATSTVPQTGSRFFFLSWTAFMHSYPSNPWSFLSSSSEVSLHQLLTRSSWVVRKLGSWELESGTEQKGSIFQTFGQR